MSNARGDRARRRQSSHTAALYGGKLDGAIEPRSSASGSRAPQPHRCVWTFAGQDLADLLD